MTLIETAPSSGALKTEATTIIKKAILNLPYFLKG